MPAKPSKRSLLLKLGIPVLGVAASAGAFFAPALLKVQAPAFAIAQPTGAPVPCGRATNRGHFTAHVPYPHP